MLSIRRFNIESDRVGYKPGQFTENPDNELNLVFVVKALSDYTITRIEVDDDDGAVWATDSINKPLAVVNYKESTAEENIISGSLINKLPEGTVNFSVSSGEEFALMLNPTGTILVGNEILNYRFFLGGEIERGQINIRDTDDVLITPTQFLAKVNEAVQGLTYKGEAEAIFTIRILSADKIGTTLSRAELLQHLYAGSESKPAEIEKKSMQTIYATGTKEFFKNLCEKLIAYSDGSYFIAEPHKYAAIAKYRYLRDLLLDNLVNLNLWRCPLSDGNGELSGWIDLHIIGRLALVQLRNGAAEVKLGDYYCLSTYK